MLDDVLKNMQTDLEILERQSKQNRTFAEYYDNAIKIRKALLLAVKTLNYIDTTATKHGRPYAYDVVNDNVPDTLKEITTILGVKEVAK